MAMTGQGTAASASKRAFLAPAVLRALRHLSTEWSTAAETGLDDLQCKQLALFLEDEKIRLLDLKERLALRKLEPNKHAEWLRAFYSYLETLGIIPRGTAKVSPPDWNDVEIRRRILSRLVYTGLEDEYQDLKEANALKFEMTKESPPGVEAFDPHENLLSHSKQLSAWAEALNSILQQLSLPAIPQQGVSCTLGAIASAVSAIYTRLHEGLEENFIRETAQVSQHSRQLQVPIGFLPKCADMHEFCAALRLLHLHELKTVQQVVNNTISMLQNITGDPRTDTKRGRVGF